MLSASLATFMTRAKSESSCCSKRERFFRARGDSLELQELATEGREVSGLIARARDAGEGLRQSGGELRVAGEEAARLPQDQRGAVGAASTCSAAPPRPGRYCGDAGRRFPPVRQLGAELLERFPGRLDGPGAEPLLGLRELQVAAVAKLLHIVSAG
jgi:hypothetical protein